MPLEMDMYHVMWQGHVSKETPERCVLLVTIISVFNVCFLPFNVAMEDVMPAYEDWHYNETVENISRMLQVSHSCFNPIILCLLSLDFRQTQFDKMLRKKLDTR